jgi:hypothetical protein
MLPLMTGAATTLLLVVPATVIYLATRAIGDAIGPGPQGLLAAAMLPTTVIAFVAAGAGMSDVALTIPITCAVAMVTLVLGMTLLNPTTKAAADATESLPSVYGATLLPASLVLLAAGGGGLLDHVTVGVLLVIGGALLISTRRLVWTGWLGGSRTLQLLLGIALAAAGGWLVWLVAGDMNLLTRPGGASQAAMFLVGPLVAVPAIGVSSAMANRGRRDEAATTLVTSAALLIVGILPLAAILLLVTEGGSSLTLAPRVARLDAALLAAVGLLVLPAALGKWKLGGAEGIGLALVYGLYLIVGAAAAL